MSSISVIPSGAGASSVVLATTAGGAFQVVGGVGAVLDAAKTIQLAATEQPDKLAFTIVSSLAGTIQLGATEQADKALINMTSHGLIQLVATEHPDRAFFDMGGASAVTAESVMLIGV